MSDHHLPSDADRWPREPFALLGVSADVDRRQLRQAYVALIRQFKPERFPKEFRRIREAYEAGLRLIEWREVVGTAGGAGLGSVDPAQSTPDAPPPAPAPSASPRPIASQPTAASESETPPPAPPTNPAMFGHASPRDLGAELEQLWDWACEGREPQAFQRLMELEQSHPGNEDIVLRLYWLLWSEPKLNPAEAPIDCLTRAIQRGVHDLRIRSLYVHELAARPANLFRGETPRFLNGIGDSHARLALASARWRAAMLAGRGGLIVKDLEPLRGESNVDASIWQYLLFVAVELLAWWSNPAELDGLHRYWHELQTLDTFKPWTSAQMDRIEFLLRLTDEWRSEETRIKIPPELVNAMFVVGVVGMEPYSGVKAVDEMARILGVNLADALELADDLRQIGPAMLIHLQQCLPGPPVDRVSPLADAADRASLVESLTAVVWLQKLPRYAELRRRLLDFCLHERISPQEAAELIDDLPEAKHALIREFAENLRQDLPLRCVYAAHAAC